MFPQTLNAPARGAQLPIVSEAISAGATSLSAYAFKGGIIIPFANVKIFALRTILNPAVASAVYRGCIAPLDSAGSSPSISATPSFSDAITFGATVIAGVAQQIRTPFSSPISLLAGNAYALMVGRTDSTSTYVLPVPGTGAINAALPAVWTYQARVASLSPANGNSIDTNSAAAAAFPIGLEWMPA